MNKLLSTASMLALGASAMAAEGDFTAPVNVSLYIATGITLVGAVVGVAIAGYAGFKVVRKALPWLRKAMG
jgi:hypothetical protein